MSHIIHLIGSPGHSEKHFILCELYVARVTVALGRVRIVHLFRIFSDIK